MNIITGAMQIAYATAHISQDVLLMIGTALLILVAELVFFFVPGVSFSSLLIALACIRFGFVPSLAIVIPPIIIAHLILLKNPAIIVNDLTTMMIMLLFGAYAGPFLTDAIGWGFYGAIFGLVKWGALIGLSFVYGGSMPKRVQNIVLEPIFNMLIFWKLRFLFGFLAA